MELLPETVVEEFIRDVCAIRTKLDSWKTLFVYEKEKKTFLLEKSSVRCGKRVCSVSHLTALWSVLGRGQKRCPSATRKTRRRTMALRRMTAFARLRVTVHRLSTDDRRR